MKRELSRLRVSMSRLRELSSGRESSRSLRVDVPAASRMLKHSLCQQPGDRDGEEEEEASGRKRKKLKT